MVVMATIHQIGGGETLQAAVARRLRGILAEIRMTKTEFSAHLGKTVSQRIRLHMIRCRVAGTAHSLRHYFCTELVERGADLRVVQELARHSQLSTTAIYVAVTDTRQRAALEMLL